MKIRIREMLLNFVMQLSILQLYKFNTSEDLFSMKMLFIFREEYTSKL